MFAGGTALINAWDVGTRHSEDLDLVVLSDIEFPPQREVAQMINQPFERATQALQGIAVPEDLIIDYSEGFRASALHLDDTSSPINIDVIVEAPARDLQLTAARRVMSTMGSVASDEDLARFPELGGYEVMCAVPAWTAANKFKALQKRAMRGKHPPDLAGITARGRDLYDHQRIAASEHGRQVRPLLDQMETRKARPLSRRREARRPPGGFGTSPLFRPGTDACEALMFGYERAVRQLVWGEAPSFEEALEAARRLDLK